MTTLYVALVLSTVAATASPAVRVTPFFSRLHDGPSFLIECPNVSGKPLPPSHFSNGAVRVDGKVHPVLATLGDGLGARTSPLGPGELWSEIVVLDQSDGKRGLASAVFGAQARSARMIERLCLAGSAEWLG